MKLTLPSTQFCHLFPIFASLTPKLQSKKTETESVPIYLKTDIEVSESKGAANLMRTHVLHW